MGMQPSTVHKILSRYGCVRLAFTDPATGAPVRAGKRQVRRFEHGSHAFADALGPEIRHKRTRPYRPQTNGKVERYNRTMLEEWAYAAAYVSESDRAARLPAFLHHYNFHRGHTALQGASPADRVHNLRGQYI